MIEMISTKRDKNDDNHQITIISNLTQFDTSTPSNFRWGEYDRETFSARLEMVYDEIVHWKRNLYEIPRGKAGSDFVSEVSRLIQAYNDATTLEALP